MKRVVIYILLLAIFLTTFSGCKDSPSSTAADTYINMANDFINTGDYTSAINVLEQGYTETNDDRLAVLLADVILLQNSHTAVTTVPPTVETLPPNNPVSPTTEPTEAPVETSPTIPPVDPMMAYSGIWAEESIDWVLGGMIIELIVSDGSISVAATYTQSAPSSRVSKIFVDASSSDVVGSRLECSFEDDSWGNAGTMVLIFSGDYIICRIQDTYCAKDDGFPVWGVAEGTFTLVRNDSAYSSLEYDMDDYNKLFGEEEPTYSTEPTYDLTKASGILAQAGLTEQEFRNICFPISNAFQFYYDTSSSNVNRADLYHLAYGRQYYEDHPEDAAVTDAILRWANICSDYENGGNNYEYQVGYYVGNYDHLFTKYQTLDNYLDDTIYAPKGLKLIKSEANRLFEDMKEYPNAYLGTPFVLIGFNVKASNSQTYSDNFYFSTDVNNYAYTEVTVYDLRDDIHSPNMLSGNEYYLYVIFQGTYVDINGNIGLNFALLSLEKCN